MVSFYREFTSDNGYLYRVNARKGTYLAFKDRSPVDNPASKAKTVVFGMHYVAFLGSRFEMVLDMSKTINFLDTQDGQIMIPFRFLGMSDVRHLRLPAFLPSSQTPIVIYHFKDYQANMLRRYFNGMQFFIVDSYVPQSEVVNIKKRFPMSRVVVFREDQEKVKLGKEGEMGDLASVRATDLESRASRGVNHEGSLFLARLYLRKLEWTKMWTLPIEKILSAKDVTYILSFLSSMLLKVFRDKDLEKHQKRLQELELLFVSIRPFLIFKNRGFERFISRAKIPRSMASYIRSVLLKQIMYRDNKRHLRQIAFLRKTLDRFDQITIVDIEI